MSINISASLRLAAVFVLPVFLLTGCEIYDNEKITEPVDTVAPTISSRVPASGATGVAITATVEAGFSEALDPDSVGNSALTLSDGTNNIAGTVALANNDLRIIFTPSADLEGETDYTVTVSSTVTDLAGNALGADDSWSFTTADITGPSIDSRSPAADALGVAVTAAVEVGFSEALDPDSVGATSVTLSDGTNDVAGAIALANGNMTIVFTPDAALASSMQYIVTVSGSVTDVAGNTLGADDSWNFTTADMTAPVVTQRSPAADATNVAVAASVEVTFSETLDPNSVAANAIVVTDNSGPVAGTVSLAGNDTVVVFTPGAELASGMMHTVTVSGAISDLAGNTLGADLNWSFTTVQAAPATARVAYSNFRTGGEPDSIRVVDISSAGILNRIEPVVNGANDEFYYIASIFALSPDGSRIAYLADRVSDAENALHIQVLETGADIEVDIGDVNRFEPLGTAPKWSPDGTKLLFLMQDRSSTVSQRNTLFMVNADGTALTRLTPFGYWVDSSFGWSPNGRYAYAGVLEQDTSDQFHGVIDPVDGELVASCGMNLPTYFARANKFRWGPGSDEIYCSGGTQFIWSPVPSATENVLFDSGTGPIFFEISPDGTKLAWTGTSPDSTAFTGTDYELWVVDLPCAKGSTTCATPYTQISNFGDDGNARSELAWSPDSSMVAFLGANMTSGTRFFAAPADGSSAPVQIGDNSANPTGYVFSYVASMQQLVVPSFAWTPDSTSVVFAGNLERASRDAFIVNVSQPGVQVLLSDQGMEGRVVKVALLPGSDQVVYIYTGTDINGTMLRSVRSDGTSNFAITENSTGVDPDIDNARAFYLQNENGVDGPYDDST